MCVLLLIACPAEQLGVELPPGGADAISHEDLRRDVRLLAEGPAERRFAERLGQMQMSAAPAPPGIPAGSTCLARGEGPPPAGQPRLLAAPWPTDADTATGAAALISVAKAWDLDGGPRGRATLCLLPLGAEAPAEALWVGPLAEGEARLDGGRFAAGPPDPARPPERIIYTDLQLRVRTLYAVL